MNTRKLSFTLRVLSMLVLVLSALSAARAEQAAPGKIELRFRATAGDRHQVVVQTDETSTQVFHDGKTQTRLQMRFGAETEVLDVAGETARIRMTYRTVAVTDTSDGAVSRYDSARDAKSKEPLPAMMNALIGSTLTLTVDQRGQLQEIEGLEELQARIAGAIELPAAEKKKLLESLAESFSQETIANSVGALILPESPIAVGDSWKRHYVNREELYSVLVNQTSKLEFVDEQNATITHTELIAPDPRTKIISEGDVTLRYQMSGSGSGKAILNRETGTLVSQENDQRLQGKIIGKVVMRDGANTSEETVEFRVYEKKSMRAWVKKLAPVVVTNGVARRN